MISNLEKLARFLTLLGLCSATALSQDVPPDVKAKIDTAVAEAYRAAAAQFPCKVKTRGKADMLRWQDVDRCLNEAAARVDWEAMSRQFGELRTSVYGISQIGFAAAVEDSLSTHALNYGQVFSVKNGKALLPLTNSVLRFLPADSLLNIPVFDRTRTQVGTFTGVYSYERSGGLATANSYRLSLFQYTDRNGNVQTATDKLLLDSFGVPWKDAANQRGYRLTSDKLFPAR